MWEFAQAFLSRGRPFCANIGREVDAFQNCQSLSDIGVCKASGIAAQCHQATRYTPCLFADFQAYVIGMGRIFCEAGDAGTVNGGSP